MVSADFLRNVLIIRYLHLSTTTHTFLVFYSLDWMHCKPIVGDCGVYFLFSRRDRLASVKHVIKLGLTKYIHTDRQNFNVEH